MTSINYLRKITAIMQKEQRPITKSYLVSKHKLNFYSVTESLEYMAEIGMVKKMNPTSNGTIYVFYDDNEQTGNP